MEDQEYKKMLEESTAFKDLDKETQRRILEAKGDERTTYVEIFQSEKNSIMEAKKELIEKNEEVVKNLGTDMATTKKDFLRPAEAKVQDDDEREAADLLESL